MPYWRISSFYFFYFASLGAMVPYWGPYLQSLGFGPREIGELIAVLMGTKIIAPNVWGWIADHFGHRDRIIRVASLLGMVAFAGIFLGSGYWWIALVMAVFSFFWNASLPQFEAITLNHLKDRTDAYSRVRVWGSIGFIVSSAGLGILLDRYDMGLMPYVVLVLFVGIWVMSLFITDCAIHTEEIGSRSLRAVVWRPEVLAFLVVCFLMQAGHGPYYAFYSIYLESHGYSKTLIGQLWALGVFAEVLVFMVMHRLVGRWGIKKVLLGSLVLAVIRWVLIGFYVDTLTVLIFAQTLHAASFGSYHAVSIELVHRYFTGRHQGRGQALYSSVSFGAGGAVGSLVSGYMWLGAGSTATFLLAASVVVVACIVTVLWVREPE